MTKDPNDRMCLSNTEYNNSKYDGKIVIWVKRPVNQRLTSNKRRTLISRLTKKAKRNPKWRDDLVMDPRDAKFLLFREPVA